MILNIKLDGIISFGVSCNWNSKIWILEKLLQQQVTIKTSTHIFISLNEQTCSAHRSNNEIRFQYVETKIVIHLLCVMSIILLLFAPFIKLMEPLFLWDNIWFQTITLVRFFWYFTYFWYFRSIDIWIGIFFVRKIIFFVCLSF